LQRSSKSLRKDDGYPLRPKASLPSRALRWLLEHVDDSELEHILLCRFQVPEARIDLRLDIIVDNPKVQEIVEGLYDPYDPCKRKVKKSYKYFIP